MWLVYNQDIHYPNKAPSELCCIFLLSFFPSQIIQRRKRSEMQTEYDFVWPNPQSLIQSSELPSPSQAQASLEKPQDPLKTSYSLWVSVCLQAKI